MASTATLPLGDQITAYSTQLQSAGKLSTDDAKVLATTVQDFFETQTNRDLSNHTPGVTDCRKMIADILNPPPAMTVDAGFQTETEPQSSPWSNRQVAVAVVAGLLIGAASVFAWMNYSVEPASVGSADVGPGANGYRHENDSEYMYQEIRVIDAQDSTDLFTVAPHTCPPCPTKTCEAFEAFVESEVVNASGASNTEATGYMIAGAAVALFAQNVVVPALNTIDSSGFLSSIVSVISRSGQSS